MGGYFSNGGWRYMGERNRIIQSPLLIQLRWAMAGESEASDKAWHGIMARAVALSMCFAIYLVVSAVGYAGL